MSFLWGHWYPCFGLLVTSALGFKARVDSLACFLACVLFLRFTSGATPANLLTASMAAEPLWPTYLQPSDVSTSIGGIEVGAMARTYGLGQGSNPWPTVLQHSALNHSTIPARLECHLNLHEKYCDDVWEISLWIVYSIDHVVTLIFLQNLTFLSAFLVDIHHTKQMETNIFYLFQQRWWGKVHSIINHTTQNYKILRRQIQRNHNCESLECE